MPNKDFQKKFSFTYVELIDISKNLCVVLTRDLADLSIFGITAEKIENLSDLTTDFEDSRTDMEYEGAMMMKTEAKNVLAGQVHDQLRFMNVRVESAFGLDSIIYATFRFINFYIQSDIELLDSFHRIIRMTKQYPTELAPYGVDPALLISLEALADDFSAALVEQEEAIDERRLAAANRTKTANQIYDLVNSYAGFGKKFYSKTNPSKYEDYLVYEKTPGHLTAPENLLMDRDSKMIIWDPVLNATSYQLEKSYDNINFSEVYFGEETYIFLSEFEDLVYYRARARNASGFGPFCDAVMCQYINPLPPVEDLKVVLTGVSPVEVLLTWNAPPTATFYTPLRSVVNIGSPSETYSMMPNIYETSLLNNAVPNRRNYYKVMAKNEGQASDTYEVYIDIVAE